MGLRFKLDENLPGDIKVLLQQSGHDALTVLEQRLGGCADEELSRVCVEEDRILVTFDIDFADARQYPLTRHSGIWILRPATQSINNTIQLVRGAISLVDAEPPRASCGLSSREEFASGILNTLSTA